MPQSAVSGGTVWEWQKVKLQTWLWFPWLLHYFYPCSARVLTTHPSSCPTLLKTGCILEWNPSDMSSLSHAYIYIYKMPLQYGNIQQPVCRLLERNKHIVQNKNSCWLKAMFLSHWLLCFVKYYFFDWTWNFWHGWHEFNVYSDTCVSHLSRGFQLF